jgi:hypothetical protein
MRGETAVALGIGVVDAATDASAASTRRSNNSRRLAHDQRGVEIDLAGDKVVVVVQ